jgi:RHS repeat-associated protein
MSVTGSSGTQSLSWDDAGRLSSVSVTPSGGPAQTTSYVYDAGGSLLLQQDPGSVTLFLADEELVLNPSAGTVSGTRFYAIGGATVAARTSAGQVSYLIGDQQGTAAVAIDASSLAVTRRYYDPYGNQVGAPPSAWPGAQGFVGGTADPATGLTNLGAREYQPATGSFISPDPLLKPTDPQDLNPYAYAGDNPSTSSDPTGQMRLCYGYCDLPPIPAVGSGGGGGAGSGGSGSGGSDLGAGGGLGGGGGSGCWYNGCGVAVPGSAAARGGMIQQEITHPSPMPGPRPARQVITNGSPAGNTCTPSNLRFAPSSSCKVTPSHTGSGGGFNPIHQLDAGYHATLRWGNTPERLINAKFITGTFNVAYGMSKVTNGVALLTVGTAEDVTGVGTILGIPTDAYGGYQLLTGWARIYKGITQFSSAVYSPMVTMTPIRYAEGAGLDIAPGGGIIQRFGGLP